MDVFIADKKNKTKQEKHFYFALKNLKITLQCLIYASTCFIVFLILKFRESVSHVIKKQAVKNNYRRSYIFCIHLHNFWAPGYLLFIRFTIHTQLLDRDVLSLASISIFYTVSLYVEVTPVIYTNGQ